ncbi:hypothetical protein D6C95_09668 [Aureobasidium pullulans]|nr:hypothetical protein D6C95_09668 [Aureobasidium pullulans]
MTTYLLFCTADISPNTITKLLEQPGTNCFVLSKDPSQASFDHWRTNPPIHAFQNGFIGWDAARIQRYLEGELPESALNPKTNITKEQFAMLDKKSEETKTVVIYQLLEKSLTEEPSSDPDEDSGDDEGEEEAWWHWNVRFQDVNELVETLETMDSMRVFCDESFVGQDGVFDVKRAKKAFVDGEKLG